jgi:hypothetical protein
LISVNLTVSAAACVVLDLHVCTSEDSSARGRVQSCSGGRNGVVELCSSAAADKQSNHVFHLTCGMLRMLLFFCELFITSLRSMPSYADLHIALVRPEFVTCVLQSPGGPKGSLLGPRHQNLYSVKRIITYQYDTPLSPVGVTRFSWSPLITAFHGIAVHPVHPILLRAFCFLEDDSMHSC